MATVWCPHAQPSSPISDASVRKPCVKPKCTPGAHVRFIAWSIRALSIAWKRGSTPDDDPTMHCRASVWHHQANVRRRAVFHARIAEGEGRSRAFDARIQFDPRFQRFRNRDVDLARMSGIARLPSIHPSQSIESFCTACLAAPPCLSGPCLSPRRPPSGSARRRARAGAAPSAPPGPAARARSAWPTPARTPAPSSRPG